MDGERQGWGSVEDAREINKEFKDHIYKKHSDIEWKVHPMNDKIKMGMVLTKKNDGLDITFTVGKVPKGGEIPPHTHEVYDIINPIAGKAKLWIKDIGEFEMKKGVTICVPPGAAHRIYDVTEDLELCDVFTPAIL